MSLLDRTIEAFSPRWAAERAYYRSVIDMSRAYDAARTGRRTDGWTATGAAANAEIGPQAARIRQRARELVRNNPYAMKATRSLAANMVGAGIVPRLDTSDREAKARARSDWNAFSENCDPEGLSDFYGMQSLVVRTFVESGEALILWLPRPSRAGLRVPLQCRVLEPDHLDASKTEALNNGGMIVQGVEYDADGRRVAYWLFDQHPGDSMPSIRLRYQSQRVPAMYVDHVFERLRPGQARGVSMFAPSALKMRDVADYDEAESVRKKIEACFAAFVTREAGAVSSPLTGKSEKDQAGRRTERLSPGMIQYLSPGEEVTFGTPSTSAGYASYLKVQLHAVAAGIGTTYEQLTGDLEGVNYSSIREGKVEFWQCLDVWQWLMLIPQLCRPAWRRVQDMRVAAGLERPAAIGSAVWAPPKRHWVDPVKDVRGKIESIRGGLTTLRDAIAETGEDPDEQIAEIVETNAVLDAGQIVLDSDPRKTSAAGLTQARAPGSTLPDTAGDGAAAAAD